MGPGSVGQGVCGLGWRCERSASRASSHSQGQVLRASPPPPEPELAQGHVVLGLGRRVSMGLLSACFGFPPVLTCPLRASSWSRWEAGNPAVGSALPWHQRWGLAPQLGFQGREDCQGS